MKKDVKVLNFDDGGVTNTESPADVIVVGDQLSSLKVLSLCIQNQFNHVVQKSNIECEAEIKVSSDMILKPESFLKYPLSNIFGVDSPSHDTETNLWDVSIQISKPDDKANVIESLVSYVEEIANPKSLSDDVRMVADELITNSIYNAPFVDEDNQFSGPDRNISVQIDPNKKPHVFAGRNQSKLVIGCTDYYGRLNIKSFIKRIEQCYKLSPRDMINFGSGGAGIGSFLIFNLAVSFYVAVEPGISTTVACAFPLKMSAKKRQELPKNIHIIFREPET